MAPSKIWMILDKTKTNAWWDDMMFFLIVFLCFFFITLKKKTVSLLYQGNVFLQQEIILSHHFCRGDSVTQVDAFFSAAAGACFTHVKCEFSDILLLGFYRGFFDYFLVLDDTQLKTLLFCLGGIFTHI